MNYIQKTILLYAFPKKPYGYVTHADVNLRLSIPIQRESGGYFHVLPSIMSYSPLFCTILLTIYLL